MDRYSHFSLALIALAAMDDKTIDIDINSIVSDFICYYFDLSEENDEGCTFRSPAHETEFLLKYGHLDLRERPTRTFTATWSMSDEQ